MDGFTGQLGPFESLPEKSFLRRPSCVIKDIIMRETVGRDLYRYGRFSVLIQLGMDEASL
jgi:hypothetical protein